MDEDLVFQASGDACGICAALDGTNCSTLPHPNCQCQIVPAENECTYEFVPHEPVRRGPGRYDFRFGGELTVTCPDGSDAGGESVEWDASGYDPDAGGWSEFAQPLIDAAVKELCDQCPSDEPPGVA
jgi:hypothetical protein